MQTKSNVNWKKVLQGAALTAFVVAPIFGATIVAQAAPPDHAPAYGYRDRNDDNYDRDRYDRDDDDRDDDDHDHRDWDHRDNRNDRNRNDRDRNDNNFYNSTRTLEGVVVNDLRGRDFVLRLGNGRNVRVQLDQREPQRLSQGDRVRVQGSFDQTNRNNRSNTRYNENLVFRANDVRIIRDRNNNWNNNSGRNNNGYYGGGNYGNYNGSNNAVSNFPAVVLDSDERNKTLRVRGENGREYIVRTNEAKKWDRGDRVRIKGRSQNGVIFAEDIDRR